MSSAEDEKMMRPLIGIPCCVKAVGTFGTLNHAVSEHYIRVVMGPVGGVPVLIPAVGGAVLQSILPQLDGILLTGSRSNVCPDFYGGPAHCDGTPEDPARDATTLPLIRASLAAGVPLLAICRGFQELNVALGGTLDQRIQDLPGRMDHSTPADQPSLAVRTGKAHKVRVGPNSSLAELWQGLEVVLGAVPVNSLHNQGVCRSAPCLVPEAWAPDGTVEAVRVKEARGFNLGVQWHPEYDWHENGLSRRIFETFGLAAAAFRQHRSNKGERLAAE